MNKKNYKYFGFVLSSKIQTIKYSCNEYLKKNKINNLHKNSVIKCDYLRLFTDSDIKFKVGKITRCELYRIRDTHNMYLTTNEKLR